MTQSAIPPAQNLTHRVATEVRAEMARQQVSQRQIGEILGISQPQVSKRLLGSLPFDTAELDKIADAFGVPVDRFLVAASSHTPAGVA